MKLPTVDTRTLSPRRKAAYYAGMAIAGLGLLSFLSTFVTFAWHFGDFTNFEGRVRSEALRAVGGIVGIMVGMALMGVGVAGAAGSGLVLDPERAARDLEPWARTSGRLSDAAFGEMHILRETLAGLARPESAGREPEPAAPVVKVRCRSCRALNDESDRFCGGCGERL